MEYKEFTIIIKKLPINIDETILISLFIDLPNPKSFRIMKDFKTKISRGFAYINFYNEIDMMITYNNLKDYVLMGNKLELILKNEIDVLEKDLNILITNIIKNNKVLLLEKLKIFGDIYSYKFEEDKNIDNKLRCYVQFKTIKSAFDCFNNLHHINNNELFTNFKSDNIAGIQIYYINTKTNIQNQLKKVLNNLNIQHNITKVKCINNISTFNIFFNKPNDAIFFYYDNQLTKMKINNIIDYNFIKVNLNKKLLLKINLYNKNINFDEFKSIISNFGEIEIFEEKCNIIFIQFKENKNMITLIDDIDSKNEKIYKYLGKNYFLSYNKLIYKTLKKNYLKPSNEKFYTFPEILKNFEEFNKLESHRKNSNWKKILNNKIYNFISNNKIKNKELVPININKMINEIIDNINNDKELLDLLNNDQEKNEVFNILINNITANKN